MTLLPLIVAALGGGLLAWATRNAGRSGTVIGVLALAAVGVLAATLRDPGPGAVLAGEPVAFPAYARLFLGAGALAGLLVTLLAVALPRWPDAAPPDARRDAPDPGPAFLLFLGAAALALGIVSPVPALLPAAAGGIAGFVAVGRPPGHSRPRGGRPDEALAEAEAGVSSLRLGMELFRIAVALAVAITALELLVGLADVIAGEPFGVGVSFLALALAVALRTGAIPLHGHAARIIEGATRGAVPVLALWGPSLFALVALAGLEVAVLPLGLPLSLERGVVAGLAALTILAGGIGALAQDDVDHVVAYSIIQDAGFVLLAFAAPDSGAWGPARTWLLVLPVAKTALLAWALVLGRTFGTRSLPELRGWARRAPLLAVALALVALATIGLPGLLSWAARAALVRGAFSEPLRTVVLATSLTSALIVARLLILGLYRPTPAVDGGPDERLRRPKPDLRRRVGATAREALDLNRAPVSAALVVALAMLAAGLGAGLFGLRAAAIEGPPVAPVPASTTEPAPTFQPVPAETPAGSEAPAAS